MIYSFPSTNLFTFVALLVAALSTAFPQSSSAQNPKVFPVVDKIYAKKEVKRPTTVEEWSSDEKSIPKGFKKLKNKNFSVVYPSCLELMAEADEDGDGVVGSPAVGFVAGEKCDPKLKAENIKNISMGLTLDGDNLTKLDDAFAEGKLLLKKSIKINSIPAIYLSTVIDDCTDDGCRPELRNHVLLICNKKTYRVRSVTTSGDISKNLIDKDDYDLPETYKTMVSSFRCNQPKK